MKMTWRQFFLKLGLSWILISFICYLIMTSFWSYRLGMNLPTMPLNIESIFYTISMSLYMGGLLTVMGLAMIILIALIKSW